MIIKTKYSLGDILYSPSTINSAYWEDCPDCDGKGYHKVERKELQIECTSCNFSYSKGRGKLQKWAHKPDVRFLTIGQVRAEVTEKEFKYFYMSQETGIGSGSLWSEDVLFETYEEALEIAKSLTDESNKLKKTIYLNDYLDSLK